MPALNNLTSCVPSLLFFAIFGFVATLNWMTVWAAIFRGKHSSWVPLVGGLFGVLGVRFLPITRLRSYWWLPLILDYGSLPGLLYTAWFLAFRRHRPPSPRDPL
jgi:hypothetical protein